LIGKLHFKFGLINIHFFQYIIFLAAIIYGPWGGAFVGGIGSINTSIILNNPYIIIGNIILGFFSGYFHNRTKRILLSCISAFFIQVPWLWLTDVYLAGIPAYNVNLIIISLLLSNIIFSFLTIISYKFIKKSIC